MIDTEGGHYAVILELRKQKDYNVLYLEDTLVNVLGVLFLKGKREELCYFKAVRKVYEVNCHKQKEQFIAAYQNT